MIHRPHQPHLSHRHHGTIADQLLQSARIACPEISRRRSLTLIHRCSPSYPFGRCDQSGSPTVSVWSSAHPGNPPIVTVNWPSHVRTVQPAQFSKVANEIASLFALASTRL